jgi:hypothetical protein
MAGFEVGIINLIADNLRDRYKNGFPILKEIIQNTDDASHVGRSVQLDFGLSDGIPDAEHPLLKGPGIFFLNNGSFTEQDARAVKSFGLNSKAADNATIGKFGLGMKSVFHFCEAFFWLAQDGETKKDEILNPWSGHDEYPPPQSVWDNFPLKEANKIKEHLKDVFQNNGKKYKSYFLLWLPLRHKDHLKIPGFEKEVGSIISEFPGENLEQVNFLFELDRQKELANLLPLLRNLTCIQCWRADQTHNLQLQYRIQIQKGAKRNSYPNTKIEKITPLSGNVKYGGNAFEDTLEFAGYEGKIEKLRQNFCKNDYWPISYVRDEYGRERPEPDKAEGHCAVTFSKLSEKTDGSLNIQWAVFLPVDGGQERKPCRNKHTYTLTLHGYFFIDAGRSAIESLGINKLNSSRPPQSENELREKWNFNLLTNGTFLLLIPALQRFVKKIRAGKEEIWNLCDALAGSKLFNDYQQYICHSFQWVLQITPSNVSWQKIKSDQKILSLPAAPQKNPNRPWETFPFFSELENEFVFIQNNAPHLILNRMPQWDEPSLLKILKIDAKNFFLNQGVINYFNLFFHDDTVSPFLKILSIQERLKNLVRNGFLLLGSQMSQVTAGVQEIVSYILPEYRYVLKIDAPTVISKLQKIKSNFLVLQKNFDWPGNPGSARLTVNETLLFLDNLDQQLRKYEIKNENKKAEECREVILEILKNLKPDVRHEILKRGRTYKIIEAYDSQLQKISSFTIEEIETAMDEYTLFLYTQGVNLKERLGLSPILQMVLPNDKIILLKSDTAKLVFEISDHGIQQCLPEACLNALGKTCKLLSTNDSRADLIGSVSGINLEDTGDDSIKGFRYLLHGDKTLFDNNFTLWVRRYKQHPVWPKLWKQLTAHEKGNILIDQSLVEQIPQKKWAALGLCEIDQQGILNDIKKKGTDFIQADALNEEDKIEVLLAAQQDRDLWQSLPLHETVSGNFICINNSTYIEPLFEYPDELLEQINIIKKSHDSRLLRFQNDPTYVKPLTDIVFISAILRIPNPSEFSTFILDALRRMQENIDFDLKKQLKEAKWLVDDHNTPLCPADVICLPEIKDEVSQLIAAEPGSFWQPEFLSEIIRQHPYFDKLEEIYFSQDEEGLWKLALLLEQNSNYAVGDLVLTTTDFSAMLNILGLSPFNQHLPGWRILYVIFKKFELDLCQQYILPAVSNSISNDKLLNLFVWLEQQYSSADGQKKDNVFICHLKYLQVFSRLQDAQQLLSNIKLLNQSDKWCSSKILCYNTEGISPSYLLNIKQRDILISLLPNQARVHEVIGDKPVTDNNQLPVRRDLEPELESTAKDLSAFFSHWENIMQPEIIGCFFSLFGDDKRILQLAKDFQGRHSVEWFRDKIPWKINRHIDHDGRQGALYGLSYLEALSQHRFIFTLISGGKDNVTSLTGKNIEVELNNSFSSLIIGKPFYEYPQNNISYVKIRLRKVNADQINPDKFSEYLKTTAEYLLKNVYEQQNCDLTALWDELNKSEQLDVRTALRLVMKHIPFYLDQLGVHKDKLISPVYNLWNESRYKIEEYHDNPEQSEKYQQEEENKRQELQCLIETDPKVQKVVLDSVRKKMKDFQYTEKSIPFELYQNADDAAVEQLEIDIHPESISVPEKLNTGETSRFVVQKEGSTIRFMHWGRPVNSIGTGGFPGRERGFHQDLEKMLILSSSNKSATHHLTGKFGLGFKSVLLACDKPRFISGKLGVEITAGLYPKQLSVHQSLYKLLAQFSNDNNRNGTLIELSLKKGLDGNIFDQFIKLSGILTVFSKTIRCIDLAGFNAKQESIEWRPEIIAAIPGTQLEKGNIILRNDNSRSQIAALYFRHLQGGGLLVGLNSQGIMALPDDLPPVWIVSPTKEKGRLGFCINGNFEVDAGRARLAGESDKNKEEAKKIGQGIGNMLCSLFQNSLENWQTVRSQLGLLPELSHYKFWESVWDTLTRSWVDPSEKQLDSEVLEVVSNLLGENSGLGGLIKEKHALPNGLWSTEFQRLINSKAIFYVLRDSLSNKSVFKPLTKWQLFKDKINPENVISSRIFPALGKILPGFTQKKDQWQFLRLAQVINWLKDNQYHVDVETANVFGEIISRKFLDSLQQTDDGKKEFENIIEQLKQLKFQTCDGSWHKSKHLLRTFFLATDDDEPLRASFAPLANVLLSSYTDIALDFFIICRGEMQAKAVTMAEWILQAVDDNQKAEALKYLIKGELGVRVAKDLHHKGIVDCWLSELTFKSPYYDGWTDDEIKELLFRILPALSDLEKRQEEDNYYEQETKVSSPGDVSKTLHNIYSWWQNNKSKYLQKYEKQTYPDYIINNNLAEDDRSAWLTILMIGSFHTFGRARPEQHRGFLSLCKKKGWWDIFIQEHPKKYPDKWMGILEEYIDNQNEDSKFEYWMRLFPTIYKFAREIENYIELFYSLETQGENVDIQQIMAPNTFFNFQGGGITAAPIAKTLGMGVPFVLREMMRKGLFNSNQKYIAPYCYVPLGRVRNFFSKMGCNDLENDESHITKSKIIYDFLCKHLGDEKAGFNNSFDIPIQYVAQDLELQKELFI